MPYTERELFVLNYIDSDEAKDAMMRAGAAAAAITFMTDEMSDSESISNRPADTTGYGVMRKVYGEAVQSTIERSQTEYIFKELNESLKSHGYEPLNENEQLYVLRSHFPDGSIPGELQDFVGMALSKLDGEFFGLQDRYYRWAYDIDGFDDSPAVPTEEEIVERIRPLGRLNTVREEVQQNTNYGDEKSQVSNNEVINEWVSDGNGNSRYILVEGADGVRTRVVDAGAGKVVEIQYSESGKEDLVILYDSETGESSKILDNRSS